MLRSLLTEPRHIEFTQSDIPVPGDDEVLIRLGMAGVCGSDVHMYNNGHSAGRPITIGHEGIGVIMDAGSGIPGARVGERVVIEPNIPCQHCPECMQGKVSICRNKRIIGVTEHGCFAEYLALPGSFAHRLPDAIEDLDAVAIEPAAVGLAAFRRSGMKPGETIAVIGLGTIGLLLTHVALSTGCRVLVTDIMDSKVQKAEKMGASAVRGAEEFSASGGNLGYVFQEAGVAAVFECAGSGNSATTAIKAAPRGADVILMGLSHKTTAFTSHSILRKGNRILPSLIYDHPVDFQKCISLVENGILKPGFVVTRHYSLKELPDAMKEAQRGQEGKIVIHIAE